MAESFPLHWPIGRPRSKRRLRSQFLVGAAGARDGLLDELRRLGARNVVVSTNVRTYTRGGQELMYADQGQAKDDPGVAVYFTWKEDQFVLCCDKWNAVKDNVQAIRKTIEALRGLERWGTGDMVRAAFMGFRALPEKGSGEAWWDVLGISPEADPAEVRTAYRRLVKDTHPDTGGDRAEFDRVQEAYRQAMSQT